MKKTTISIALFFLTTIILSQNIVDKQWGFKLDIPSSWSQNDYMDGPDKVYDFYSADKNAGFSLRIFNITSQITYEILIPVFEQNIFPEASRLALKDLTSKNGIPGKQAMYSMDNNGNKIDIAVFYTLQNSKGYVFSALVVSDIAENYKNDILSTTASFIIDGVGENPPKKNGLGSISDLLKKQKDNQPKKTSNNSVVVGRYMFDYSKGDNRTNFNNIYIYKNGTYEHEYQPKNSGNYIGGTKGTWKLEGNTLTLIHNGNGALTDVYTLDGRKLIRTTNSGKMVYFRE
ncbi:MAG: hypothetical protein ACJA1B_000011 [Polaribacter sp.]|jgi:hypothetical protein